MNQAVFLHGPRDVRIAPINLREGRLDETLVEVAAVGICIQCKPEIGLPREAEVRCGLLIDCSRRDAA
jgi:hypothetical protein